MAFLDYHSFSPVCQKPAATLHLVQNVLLLFRDRKPCAAEQHQLRSELVLVLHLSRSYAAVIIRAACSEVNGDFFFYTGI